MMKGLLLGHRYEELQSQKMAYFVRFLSYGNRFAGIISSLDEAKAELLKKVAFIFGIVTKDFGETGQWCRKLP